MSEQDTTKKKKKWPIVVGISTVVVLFLLVFGKPIFYKLAAYYIYSNMEIETTQEAESETQSSTLNAEEESRDTLNLSDVGSGETVVRDEEYITNFLIVGVEEIDGARNTDSMMIATIDTEEDTIKLTSLMRDSYVNIPGYGENKLNAAFAKGGMDLLIETIEANYLIAIDGYAWVGFESFEEVIDLLGGVEIEISAEEADYLNTANYISDYSNHNLVEGVNLMNGNQALGYCRVRHVATVDGEMNDYGRTSRHRTVLNAVFDKYKSSNVLDLFNITSECLSYVNTNLSLNTIERVIQNLVDNKITTLEMNRLPVDDAYESPVEYDGITYPLVYDWDANLISLYQFLYNDTYSEAVENLNTILEANDMDLIDEDDDDDDESSDKYYYYDDNDDEDDYDSDDDSYDSGDDY